MAVLAACDPRQVLCDSGTALLARGHRSARNADMAAEIGAESQSHVAWVIHRFGPLRPARGFGSFKTPIARLYLGGAGSHPGAAVTGTPGYLGADEVLRDVLAPREFAHASHR